jgi:hypothetical protein
MFTCEQCGADFDQPVRSCELCGGAVQNNGRESHYTQAITHENHTARSNPQPQYYEPEEEPRYLPPARRYLPAKEPQQPYNEYLPPRDSHQPQRGTAESFRALFGLHPTVAALAIIIGGVLAAAELVGLPLSVTPLGWEIEIVSVLVGLVAAIPLALITYLAQTEWGGDTKRSAGIKALMVGFLTAIPGGVLGYKKLSKIIQELSI